MLPDAGGDDLIDDDDSDVDDDHPGTLGLGPGSNQDGFPDDSFFDELLSRYQNQRPGPPEAIDSMKTHTPDPRDSGIFDLALSPSVNDTSLWWVPVRVSAIFTLP